MKFRYSRYEIERSPTIPSGIVFRPEIVVRIIGPDGSQAIQALVDTGSDETVFPIGLAAMLGVELDDTCATTASAVGGHEVQLLPGLVAIAVSDGDKEYRWDATVEFLETQNPEDEVALLGYAGFLEYFTATFDSERCEINLTANGRLPA